MNDDQELEREADTMGAKTASGRAISKPGIPLTPAPSQEIIQGTFNVVNYTFTTADQVEDNKQKILNEIPKKSGPSGNDVVKLLKKWAKDADYKGRFLSYKALARAGLKALREEQAKALPHRTGRCKWSRYRQRKRSGNLRHANNQKHSERTHQRIYPCDSKISHTIPQ